MEPGRKIDALAGPVAVAAAAEEGGHGYLAPAASAGGATAGDVT
jgi:hypothetical protein